MFPCRLLLHAAAGAAGGADQGYRCLVHAVGYWDAFGDGLRPHGHEEVAPACEYEKRLQPLAVASTKASEMTL